MEKVDTLMSPSKNREKAPHDCVGGWPEGPEVGR